MSKPRLRDIAAEINGYLKQFEADPKINSCRDPKRIKPYYHACAFQHGRYVGVTYVSFQGHTSLTREDAETYLGFLRSGGVGRHYRAI